MKCFRGKVLLMIGIGIASAWMATLLYDGYQFSKLDFDAQVKTHKQKFFNEDFDYTSINNDTNNLRDIISKTHIELHGDIEDIKVVKLRERIFELIWTHHAGGFSNYMKLRKPKGIEYNLYTNSRSYHHFINGIEINVVTNNSRIRYNYITNGTPQMTNEIDYIKWLDRDDNFTNLISELCLDYDSLQEIRYVLEHLHWINTNALFGVHIIRTNSLDTRFCGDVLDFESSRFNLLTNAVLVSIYAGATPLYTTPETPRQELETTGEITIAYAYFTFKCIHHNNNASPFIAQWHWDKNLNRWITDYFCSGDDYRNPNTRYYSEPLITTIF